jgi:hypothetical protein
MKFGPRKAGRKWTRPEDNQLIELETSGMSHALIARKLKRTVSAIDSRLNGLRKRRLDQAGLKAKPRA